MVLRFDIVITETTKNCQTAVLFSLDSRRMKTHKHVWVTSTCVVFTMFRRHNYVDKGRFHVNWNVFIAKQMVQRRLMKFSGVHSCSMKFNEAQ